MAPKHDRSPSREVDDPDTGKIFKRKRPAPTLSTKRKAVPTSDAEDEISQPIKKKSRPPHSPTRPEGGRPAHRHRPKRTDNAPPATLTGLTQPQTPPRKHKSKTKTKPEPPAFFSPETSRITGFTMQMPIHFTFQSPTAKHESTSKTRAEQEPRAAINAQKHSPEDGWIAAGSCLTVETYRMFELWKNDFTPKTYSQAPSVKMIHLGTPCDRAKDIRARKWILAWNTEDRNMPPKLIGKKRPVYRVVFHCSGHCRHGPSDDDDSDAVSPTPSEIEKDDDPDAAWVDVDKPGYVSVDSVDEETSSSSSSGDDIDELSIAELNAKLNAGSTKKSKRPPADECDVIIHAEVYSDDLSKIYFFQLKTHPETLVQYLDPSPYIRQCTLEMSRTLGLSPSNIKRRLLKLFVEDETHITPLYRRYTATQVNNVVNNARRKERLLSDPLLSIGVFAEQNPDKIFGYSPPNYETDPPREFRTGIRHPYGTQVMLLWAWLYGVGHDATYRHMNENRAPLTVMITLDPQGRMVPGFAYLSGDTTTETQIMFLRETKKLVEKMAEDLVNVFPLVCIRVCQFHVMQAILRWQRDHAPAGERQTRPALDNKRKHQLLYAVREIQRCRDPARWQEYLDQFRRHLDIIAQGSRTSSQTLWDYFEANWFCDEWREHWTDMGLPIGQNRDGMLSTNNWTERAFKTFNQVFLGNRNNKSEISSIFRLVLILANEWFEYYQAWKPKKQFNTKRFKTNAQGHHIWSCTGAVQPFEMPDGRRAWRVAQRQSSVNPVLLDPPLVY
ncbi:hypothetical protein C8R44DRAFT_884294 [Mycena epipterygia]|nr:hypothetical protein C8R44DRAFT_884294 [Mycena epipterygia]